MTDPPLTLSLMESERITVAELAQLMSDHYVYHRRIGDYFFIPAIEEVPGWAVNACIGMYPVIPFNKRRDLPEELKENKYWQYIIYFYGLGSPLGRMYSSLTFCHSPSTDAGLLALQQLNLDGKTLLDAGCRLGEHTILPAKMGAYVIGISRSIEGAEKNVALNNVKDRVTLIKGDLSDMDLESLGDISIVIENGAMTQNILELKGVETIITCEPNLNLKALRGVGYSNFTPVAYGKATALIARR